MVIGSPATVVSGNRTVRVITVSKTVSPNASSTRANTSRPCSVRPSYIVARMPSSLSVGLSRSRTLSMVSMSRATPAQREELALERHDHAVRRGQRVDGQQAEGRLAVDEDVVVVVDHRRQRAGQRLLAGDLADQLHLGRGQVDVAGQQVHPGDAGLEQDVVDGDPALHQQVVGGAVELVRLHAQADRQRTLRVEVDQQHPAPELGERSAEIDRRRRLADAALLVAQRDDAGRPVPVERLGVRQGALGAGHGGIGRRRGRDGEQFTGLRFG